MQHGDAFEIGAGAGEFEQGGAPDAVADAADAFGIHLRLFGEHLESGFGAGANERAILPGEAELTRGILGGDALAVEIDGEGDVAQLGELRRALPSDESIPGAVMRDEDARSLAGARAIKGENAFQDDGTLLVFGWPRHDLGRGDRAGEDKRQGGNEPSKHGNSGFERRMEHGDNDRGLRGSMQESQSAKRMNCLCGGRNELRPLSSANFSRTCPLPGLGSVAGDVRNKTITNFEEPAMFGFIKNRSEEHTSEL